MIEYVNGDLFAANERAIAHGCNCHGVMGAGVAKIVAERFPFAYKEYNTACRQPEKQFYPGCAQPVWCTKDGEVTIIYNLATQNAPGANADTAYILRAMRNMRAHMDYVGNRRVAMPKIGSGIGGLEWSQVEHMIKMAFYWHPSMGARDYQIVVYEL